MCKNKNLTLYANVTVNQIPLDCFYILTAHFTIRYIIRLGIGHLKPILVLNRHIFVILLLQAIDLNFNILRFTVRVDYVEKLVEHSAQTQLKVKNKLYIVFH